AYVHLRPSMFMQSILTLAEPSLRKDGELRLPLGEAWIHAVDVRDVADVAAAALLEGEETSGPRLLVGRSSPPHAIAADIGTRLGRPVRYVAVGDDAAAAEWRSHGVDTAMVAMLGSVFAALRDGLPPLADELERWLGRPARTWSDAAGELQSGTTAWRDANLEGTLRA
ncbi:MAG TPA: hypothetical protein VHC01_12410, partial [Gaiellaceae bacterium]|nr:hypothetical protein [Gaiellaceae bacterium]